MMHECPAPGCTEQVPSNLLACRPHWYSIPVAMRTAIWNAYRLNGQGSTVHIKAISAAISYLRRQQINPAGE